MLEAVLRLYRLGEGTTPEDVAAEAILHLDDVRAGIACLVGDGYLDSVAVMADSGAETTIVSPSPGLRRLLQSAGLGQSAPQRDRVAATYTRDDPEHGRQ